MKPLEKRITRGTVEFRAAKPGKKMPGMRGYALKFDRLSQNLGGFVERVMPGAVDKSLADGLDVLARYNHDDNFLLGRTSSGTLTLEVDDTGLVYDAAELPDTSAGRDVAVLLERGDVAHSSFAFHMVEDDWSMTEQGFPLRSLLAIRLVDVAPVNTPAYMDTSSALRSLAARVNVDPEDVPPLLERGELARMLAAPVVVDLAPAPTVTPTPSGDGSTAQGETHAAGAVRARRLALLARRTF